MEINTTEEARAQCNIGNKSTSDVVVRIRTQEGRDEWLYCHSHVLVKKTKYFGSDGSRRIRPRGKILDSKIKRRMPNTCHGVRNAIGTLQVAVELGCEDIIVDSTTINDDDSPPFKMDGELWQSLESAFVSNVASVHRGDQAKILTDWLRNQITLGIPT
ncbi:hypothetical protein IFM89_027489 [Coptis chinensis]|uniref:Uncharacterized protein n=1 Tax=Coptis chinensis TaxID=261450 RepID=A0A835M4D7_9MAGN|nr:hypothetical protein IFM89_027489 [Coptis chinensis]